MRPFSPAECCQHYIKSAQSGGSIQYLPSYSGAGLRQQQGQGWIANVWKGFLYPHILKPIFSNLIVPGVKRAISERVAPSLRKGLSDVRSDWVSGERSVKDSVKQRGRETWKRIIAPSGQQQHGSGKRRRKRCSQL